MQMPYFAPVIFSISESSFLLSLWLLEHDRPYWIAWYVSIQNAYCSRCAKLGNLGMDHSGAFWSVPSIQQTMLNLLPGYIWTHLSLKWHDLKGKWNILDFTKKNRCFPNLDHFCEVELIFLKSELSTFSSSFFKWNDLIYSSSIICIVYIECRIELSW